MLANSAAGKPSNMYARGQTMQEQNKQHLQICSIGFSALACISLGVTTLASVLLLARARPVLYVMCGAVGAISIALMYRRIAVQWRAVSALEREERQSRSGKPGNLPHLRSSLMLALLGYLSAQLAGSGWITAFFPCVAFIHLFPWSRIALCRRSLAIPLSILCAGMTMGLIVAGRLPHPLVLGGVAWMLCTAAVFAWFRLSLIDSSLPRSMRTLNQDASDRIEDGAEVPHNSWTCHSREELQSGRPLSKYPGLSP